MRRIALVSTLLVTTALVLPAASLAADAAKPTAAAYKAPRILGNVPDLGGNWTNSSLTPLERDPKFGERLTMTDQEARQIEGAQAASIASRNQPTKPDTKIEDLPCSPGFTGTNCGYNVGWTDFGEVVMRVKGEPRTSLITSTANGRIPQAKAHAGGRGRGGAAGGARMSQDDNPETRSLAERCLTSFGSSSGPIMQPQMYNSNYRFVQSKEGMAILVEMVHDVRVIRIKATKAQAMADHRTDGVRPWMGDSVGWYEGDTLVADTTNFHPRQNLRGSSANLHMTERFTRTAPDRILYQFTAEDPTVWDTPWSGEYEFFPAKGDVYEYACHEGNYALEGILAGARNDEAIAAGLKSADPRPVGYNPDISRGPEAAAPIPRGGRGE